MEAGKRARARPLGTDAAAAFLGELEVSGNVLRAAAAAGVGPWTAYRRRARDAAFAGAWDAAVARAAARLIADGAADAGGFDTVRRQSGGRPQLTSLRAGEWTARTERDFLDMLSATANVRAAADGAGVSVSGAWVRRRREPAFAQAWTEAVDDGHARLELLLMERGAALLGGADFLGQRSGRGAAAEAADGVAREAFDPHVAMWLLKRRDQARAGTLKRGQAWRRVPDLEEVREGIARKLAAIRRARDRSEDGSAGSRGAEGGAAGEGGGGRGGGALRGGDPCCTAALDTRTHDS